MKVVYIDGWYGESKKSNGKQTKVVKKPDHLKEFNDALIASRNKTVEKTSQFTRNFIKQQKEKVEQVNQDCQKLNGSTKGGEKFFVEA